VCRLDDPISSFFWPDAKPATRPADVLFPVYRCLILPIILYLFFRAQALEVLVQHRVLPLLLLLIQILH
jgi:hypothetical protein